jgi:hypothetical protein
MADRLAGLTRYAWTVSSSATVQCDSRGCLLTRHAYGRSYGLPYAPAARMARKHARETGHVTSVIYRRGVTYGRDSAGAGPGPVE